MDIKLQLGNRIRYLRKELNLSQEALAFESGLDRTYICSVENGHRNISIVNVEKISRALNCSVGQLFE